MYDYAQVFLLGRAANDPEISYKNGKAFKAVFVLAMNTPLRRDGHIKVRTLFRRIMVLGSYAHYIDQCGGLRGRLINITGVMDDEQSQHEVVRVAPGAGFIKIMDRRSKDES